MLKINWDKLLGLITFIPMLVADMYDYDILYALFALIVYSSIAYRLMEEKR